MNKLDVHSPTLTLSPASPVKHNSARRLIVLLPEAELDTTIIAQKIWALADSLKSHVQFIGISKDMAREPALRRQLTTLSALVRDDRIVVESKLEFGGNWLKVLQSDFQEGDVIACFAEQRSGLARRPLSQVLESKLHTTIYILSGLYHEDRFRFKRRFEAMAWTGSIGIILGLSWLQMKLIHLPQDWAHTSLLYASFLVELWLVWMWNSLF